MPNGSDAWVEDAVRRDMDADAAARLRRRLGLLPWAEALIAEASVEERVHLAQTLKRRRWESS
jgi:hypothetical protein